MQFNTTQLANNLHSLRVYLKMNAKDFGYAIGVTRQTINNLESGRAILHDHTYMAIVGALYSRNAKVPFSKEDAEFITKCFVGDWFITVENKFVIVPNP